MKISTNTSFSTSANRINPYLLSFGHATVDAGWNGSVFSPVFSRLYYIMDGSFFIKGSDGKKIELKKGNWYLIPAGYSFTYVCEKAMEHFYAHIKLCDFDGADLLRSCHSPLSLKIEKCTPYTMIKSIESNNITDGLSVRQTVFGIILKFIKTYNISISSEDYSPIIYNAITYIKQNLSMQLTISEIADCVFVSKSTLTKHFKKELKMSVNEYICNTIMSEAQRLLTSTNISIFSISQKFGFSDQFYFSRRFKEKFGITPSEYRKKQLL